MSNFLAIATVTATLHLALKAASEKALGVAVNVTTRRPDAPTSGDAEPRINLCLYQVTPNAAWRNAVLPTRNSAGRLVDRPQVALDLHYLLSFYGNEDELTPQRLLGSVAQSFYSHQVLTRQMIRATLDNDRFRDLLNESNLADDIELVKFTPISMSLEELSKLWSVFFQTSYTLSVAYLGTVVLIESDDSHQAALPVRERQLVVAPFRQPVIEKVTSQARPNQPIVLGDTLVIRGHRLSGETTFVRVGDNEVTMSLDVSDTEINFPLTEPTLPVAALRAGVQGVQVVQRLILGTPPAEHRGIESNVAAFVLHPSIVPPVTASSPQASVTVTISPPVGQRQRVVLLLNEFGSDSPVAYSFAAPPRSANADAITFTIRDVAPGDYLVRVQVDGAESPLTSSAAGQFDSPRVVIS